jgi:site-specific DNA-methyltransferase (adenine-specific)
MQATTETFHASVKTDYRRWPEERRIARVRELSADTLANAFERAMILQSLNLKWHEYESRRIGITFQTGYRLIQLLDHPRMQRDDWERPAQWTVCHEILQTPDKCFEAMLKAGFVCHSTTRRQVRDFCKAWKRRPVVKCERQSALVNIGVTIYNEDCLTGMARIESGSVDMILADLPFQTTENKWDVLLPLDQLWEQYKRVIRPNGAIVLTAQIPFSIVLASSNLPWLKYEWIWQKEQGTGFLNAKMYPLKSHENILVFCEGIHTYNPQMEPGKAYVGKPKTKQSSNWSRLETVVTVNEGNRYPQTVLKFDHDKENHIHPTQKPVALFEYLVRTYTNPGELVLDNCIGSGTTGVACINADRRFVGYELDPDYFAAAKDRIERHKAKSKDLLADLFES